MREMRHRDRRSLSQGLFAPRQVYVRNGPVSQYVTLSRSLQVAVAAGMAVIALWLGLASYAALAKHRETVAQGRELTRLESVAKTLRASLEEAQEDGERDAGAAASADLMTELAELQQSRERALQLAAAAADEAAELRREVALGYERIRELELRLLRDELDERAPASLVSCSDAGGIAGALLGEVACPAR